MTSFKWPLNAFKRYRHAWQPITTDLNSPNALVVYYSKDGVYIWGCGRDYLSVRQEYKDVTHYKIVSEAP